MKLILCIYLILTLITFFFAVYYLFNFIKKVNTLKEIDTPIWGFIILIIIISPIILLLSMIPVLSQFQLYKELKLVNITAEKIASELK